MNIKESKYNAGGLTGYWDNWGNVNMVWTLDNVRQLLSILLDVIKLLCYVNKKRLCFLEMHTKIFREEMSTIYSYKEQMKHLWQNVNKW